MIYLQVAAPLLTSFSDASEGSAHMVTFTLRQCLEQLAQVGSDYVVSDQGIEWTAAALLASLTRQHPDRLELAMYLRFPDAHQDGAICQLTRSGGFILRYRIYQNTPL